MPETAHLALKTCSFAKSIKRLVIFDSQCEEHREFIKMSVGQRSEEALLGWRRKLLRKTFLGLQVSGGSVVEPGVV
jgi:hypothetical protein